MSETPTNEAQGADSTAERFEKLQQRAKSLSELPVLSRPAEAGKIMSDGFGVLADLARDVEAMKPYADEAGNN